TRLTFRVTFNAAVAGVDASDFALTTTGNVAGTVAAVARLTPFAYDVTVDAISGTGAVRLDLAASGTGITGPGGTPIAGGFTGGETYHRATLAWTNPVSGGVWSDAANWDGRVVADGVGAVPVFGSFDVTANVAVTLDAPRTVSGATFGDADPASPASWTLASPGSAKHVLTLDTVSGVPAVTVNALGTGASASLDVPLAGNKGLGKAGAGTLVLTQPLDLTGQLNVSGGTLRFAPGSSMSASTVTVSAGGTLDLNGGTFTASGGTTVNGNGGSLIVNAGTGTFAAVNTNNSANGLIRVNGGTFSAASINIPRSSDGTPSFASGFVVTGGSATVATTIGVGTNNSWGSMSVEGGSLSVGGVITVGNQGTGGRGGQLRVTGGTFAANASIVLGARANNISRANFTGGTSTVASIVLGSAPAVTSGSATLTVDGGTLYLGSGGIVATGSGTFSSNLVLSSGVLGASADWATALPVFLPAGGNITLSTADASGEPHDITLSGLVSGAGGLTKTGAGTLILRGDHTYTGPTVLDGGGLQVHGSLASPVVLNETAVLGLSSAPVSLGSDLTWNGGAAIALPIGATGRSGQLAVAGAFTKGNGGSFSFAFDPGEGFAAGNTYTIATFTSTNFTADDFTAIGLPAGYAARFALTATSLQAAIVGTPFITSAPSATGTYGEPFTYTIAAGNAPETFHAAGLPDGLTFDQATGAISGTPAQTGTFHVTISATNLAGTGAAPLTLTIAKATATVTLAELQQAYDGTPRIVTATTNPADLNVTVTYDGAETPPILPGTYEVVATVVDDNYAGSATGTLTITVTALVRHAPVLNGDVDGSLQVLLPESVTLNGSAAISGDLLVPGTPRVQLNGSPLYGGTQDASGSAAPTNHSVTLNHTAVLRHVVRRVDAIAMPAVSAPQAPAGTRSVTLNSASQSAGDFATLRNLTLNSGAGAVAVPAGAYGAFTANGGSSFVLGVAGASQPAVYHLQSLTLNSGARIQIVGPVIIRLAGSAALNGGVSGHPGHPEWLLLESAHGSLTLNSGAALHGSVHAPHGTVSLNASAAITGRVAANRLNLNGSAALVEP
ncbi:MAG TPA: MBG domain-containing protein, partial [Opitutus sp.]|nr:MBG domain-containing protein [Opitutus sp.]